MEPREARRLLSDVAQLRRVLESAEAGVAAAEAKLARAQEQGEAARAKALAYRDDIQRQLAEAREAAKAVTPELAEAAGVGPVVYAYAETAMAEVRAN